MTTARVLRFAVFLLPAVLSLVASGSSRAEPLTIGYLGQAERPTSYRIQPVPADEGLAGAQLGIADNASSGRFAGLAFDLLERRVRPEDVPQAAAALSKSTRFIVGDLDPADLRAAALGAGGALVINARASADRLRNEECLSRVLHTAPSHAMLADGLGQYLAWKRWRRWFLVTGPEPEDRDLAASFRAAARKFGSEIAAEKDWTFRTANARADTGHVTLQTEIPAATRVADHDVLVVADTGDTFGDHLMGRTALPRPVAGTHGLVTTGWSRANDQFGASQLQSRFARRFDRAMTAVDYAAWLAVRAVGEAALRTRSRDPQTIEAYLRGSDFLVGGFKGRGQSFRPWDGQMRQPILIAGSRVLVSVSPQPGFLHRHTELDTLGTDQEESRCRK